MGNRLQSPHFTHDFFLRVQRTLFLNTLQILGQAVLIGQLRSRNRLSGKRGTCRGRLTTAAPSGWDPRTRGLIYSLGALAVLYLLRWRITISCHNSTRNRFGALWGGNPPIFRAR